MEMLRKQQLHELPTIMDEQKKMEERITKEMKDLGEVRAGPRGASTGSAGGKDTVDVEMAAEGDGTLADPRLLILAPSDFDSMLQLGQMALSSYDQYERLFDLPKYMRYEVVQA